MKLRSVVFFFVLSVCLGGLMSSCGTTRRGGQGAAKRKYKPLRCPCDKRSDVRGECMQGDLILYPSEAWGYEIP